ncbi:hypothetical protein [Conexibacter sp. SYSU D00693]|uniref:hypothetical protein n=1 Tax=Conexibacter sp. SYSU D00693 TaxID=2812560 RepID=UPI00196B9216|nr:hypothetical protein [Conexibacter sp. SYSU D00693]
MPPLVLALLAVLAAGALLVEAVPVPRPLRRHASSLCVAFLALSVAAAGATVVLALVEQWAGVAAGILTTPGLGLLALWVAGRYEVPARNAAPARDAEDDEGGGGPPPRRPSPAGPSPQGLPWPDFDAARVAWERDAAPAREREPVGV